MLIRDNATIETCLALLVMLCVSVGDAVAQTYEVVELRALPGQSMAAPQDINNQLQIVGLSGDQVCVWDIAGDVRALGITGTGSVTINNQGVVAGTRVVSGRREPFLWSNGVISQPPIPPGDFTGVRALTDNGIVLMSTSSGSWAAVGDALYDLTFTGAAINDVNEAGTIGGSVGMSAGYLRYLDGRVLTAPSSEVQTIGSAGHFGGTISVPSGPGLFFGMPGGAVTVIERFGRFAGHIYDVNARGAFVGRDAFILFGLGTAGILYSNNRLVHIGATFGTLTVSVQSAYAINDQGYILASARIANGPVTSVLLVPVAAVAPAGLSFSVNGRVVTLKWTASVGALDYVLEAGSIPGASNLFNAPIGSSPGLTIAAPPGRYYVRVRARNDAGISAPSAEVVVDVP